MAFHDNVRVYKNVFDDEYNWDYVIFSVFRLLHLYSSFMKCIWWNKLVTYFGF